MKKHVGMMSSSELITDLGEDSDYEEGQIMRKIYQKGPRNGNKLENKNINNKIKAKSVFKHEIKKPANIYHYDEEIPGYEAYIDPKKMDFKISIGEMNSTQQVNDKKKIFKKLYKKIKLKEKQGSNNKGLICKECGTRVYKAFKITKHGTTKLEIHQMKHKVKNFTCTCPKEKFTSFIAKERHMKVVHMEWLGCTLCHMSFPNESGLKNHIEIHEENEPYSVPMHLKRRGRVAEFSKNMICSDCGKNIGRGMQRTQLRNKYIRLHLLKHQVENFSCDCSDLPQFGKRKTEDKIGQDFKIRERHMKTVHQGWFGCRQCIQSYETKERLRVHEKEHNDIFSCTICDHKTNSKTALYLHKRKNHSVTISLTCPECQKLMRSPNSLKCHQKKVHNATVCNVCGKVIKNIKQHMGEMHIEQSKKKYQCNKCERGFMTKQKLEDHNMNVHIKSQPYRCRFGCENCYNDRSNRNAHERRRHGNKL